MKNKGAMVLCGVLLGLTIWGIIYNNTYVDAKRLGDFELHWSEDSTSFTSEVWYIEIIPATESIWGRGYHTVGEVRVKRKHLGLVKQSREEQRELTKQRKTD